jgi:hypothetical protein
MPWRKMPSTETRCALVCFDESGTERSGDRDASGGRFSDKVIDEIRAHRPIWRDRGVRHSRGGRCCRKNDAASDRSGAHSDIDRPEVAHAIWQAARDS